MSPASVCHAFSRSRAALLPGDNTVRIGPNEVTGQAMVIDGAVGGIVTPFASSAVRRAYVVDG
jgi:hypothetical protein